MTLWGTIGRCWLAGRLAAWIPCFTESEGEEEGEGEG